MAQEDNDRLEWLLQQADTAAGPGPRLPADLVGQVRRRAQRARRIRMGFGALAAAMVLSGGLIWLFSSNLAQAPGPYDQPGIVERAGPGANDEEELARLRTEIERLDAQVASLSAAVQQMRQVEADYRRLNELRRELVSLDISDQIAREVDEAVFVMIYDADRRLAQGQRDSAIKVYKQVIRLFPQNRWAKVAREKLAKI